MGGYRIITAVPAEGPLDRTQIAEAIHGLPPGFRFVTSNDLDIVEPVLLYLHDSYARNKRPWERVKLSERSACDDLYEWFCFLELATLDWTSVGTDEIRGYRTILENAVSPRTCRRYAINTVRKRLGTILAFYKWSLTEKYICEPVDSKKVKRGKRPLDTRPLAHLESGLAEFESSDLVPGAEITAPSPFHRREELQAVLTRLGPLPLERPDDCRNARNRLAATFAVVTGARLSEVLGITLSELLSVKRPSGASQTTNVFMWLNSTKGGRPRRIIVPVWMLDELLAYAETERHLIVGRARELSRRPAPNLFLNGLDASDRDVGNKLTARTLSRAFRDAVIAEGFYTSVGDGEEPEGVIRLIALHTFHDLRHTFAVQQYLARKAKGDAEPWKIIATQLGHRSWQTTMEYYLPSVSLNESDLSDIMSDFFSELASWRHASAR